MFLRLLAATLALSALLSTPSRAQVAGKKVLFVNSYHEGFEWADGEEKGAKAVLDAAGVQLKFVRMDTKRHQEEAFLKAAGEKVKAEIESFKPDVVLLADDPAVKLVLAAHYKNGKVPFVFCGVNWDAAKYGFPMANATGMVEVALVKNLLDGLKDYAKGARVGFLSVDSETERFEGQYYKKQLGLAFASEKYVKGFAEWKAAFVKLQGEADVLLVGNFAGIKDWNDAEAAEFASANSKIVSGAVQKVIMPYAMLGYTKVPEEQGAWAAKTALEILKGAKPGSIEIAANKQAEIFINPKLAAKAGVTFKPDLVRNAKVFAK